MKHRDVIAEDTWGRMLAVDFFFAGMGGGMLVISGIVEMFLGKGRFLLLGNFLAPLFIAAGAGFLILELGRPAQAWRVFLNPRAILTAGAWNMLLAIGFGVAFASFGITSLPWSEWAALRKLLALLAALFGLVVASYPGILLGRHKSRPFWTGIGIMVLFLTSSLATGAAAHLLSSQIVPPPSPGIQAGLAKLSAGLLAVQLIFWPAYLWVKASGTTQREAAAVGRWIRGDLAQPYRFGILLTGTLAPLILYFLPGAAAPALAAALVLAGGLLVRLLVVRSGDQRTWLPGEEKYRSRLPRGDEPFLTGLKRK